MLQVIFDSILDWSDTEYWVVCESVTYVDGEYLMQNVLCDSAGAGARQSVRVLPERLGFSKAESLTEDGKASLEDYSRRIGYSKAWEL